MPHRILLGVAALLGTTALVSCASEGGGQIDPPVTAAPASQQTAQSTASEEAADPYKVELDTTAGKIVIQVHPEWAPRGAERFRELVESDFYDGVKIFRVVPGFVAQFGMSGDPAVNAQWRYKTIPDDPVKVSNKRGTVTFATSGADSRTTQIFINFADNARLDSLGFAPFGEVVEGMDAVGNINSEYGERPNQDRIREGGNEYLEANFPNLTTIKDAKIVGEEGENSGDAEAGN